MSATQGAPADFGMERDCNTCQHHVQGSTSIDQAPELCWDCAGKEALPNWQPIVIHSKPSSTFRLIGLTGLSGSGKDTTADALCNGLGFERYALARPIKAALNAMFGWTWEQWEDREWKERVIPELGFSPRRAAQTLGTEWGRGLNSELWLNLARKAVVEARDSGLPGLAITDVRFDNEAECLIDLGGEVWKIERADVAPVEAHSSEKGVSKHMIAHTIWNDSSIGNLQQFVLAKAGR